VSKGMNEWPGLCNQSLGFCGTLHESLHSALVSLSGRGALHPKVTKDQRLRGWKALWVRGQQPPCCSVSVFFLCMSLSSQDWKEKDWQQGGCPSSRCAANGRADPSSGKLQEGPRRKGSMSPGRRRGLRCPSCHPSQVPPALGQTALTYQPPALGRLTAGLGEVPWTFGYKLLIYLAQSRTE
jgi:hypothetical protein